MAVTSVSQFHFYSVEDALKAMELLTLIDFRYVPISHKKSPYVAKIIIDANFTEDVDHALFNKTSIPYHFCDDYFKETTRIGREGN